MTNEAAPSIVTGYVKSINVHVLFSDTNGNNLYTWFVAGGKFSDSASASFVRHDLEHYLSNYLVPLAEHPLEDYIES